jgi:hypothetical protein
MKKITMALAAGNGAVNTTAYQTATAGLVVHRVLGDELRRGWALTHKATGLRILSYGQFKKRSDVVRFAERLGGIVDWTMEPQHIVRGDVWKRVQEVYENL